MLATLLPEGAGVHVEQIIVGEDIVTVVARLSTPAQPCPACSHLASQVHSRSRRTCRLGVGGFACCSRSGGSSAANPRVHAAPLQNKRQRWPLLMPNGPAACKRCSVRS